MANFTETKLPYEFLVRWDAEGKLSGAHVGFRTITKKDDVVLADITDPVQPVAVGVDAGFPLADILQLAQAGFTDQGAAFIKAAQDAEQAEADAKAAQAAAKAAADAAEAENARFKAAQAEADRMAAEAKDKAEFDAAVAAKVAELTV